MATPPAVIGTLVQLEREIAAPPDAAFEAFTRRETLSRWFAPADDFGCVVHELDVRPGGRYRIEMRDPAGPVHVVSGTYETVERPRLLVFTWAWEGRAGDGVSRVTVRLEPGGRGTRLTLVHELLPTPETREAHAKGWIGCLGRLERVF
jgi:uncharacterized protein YndB with AHSA1/START domain